MPAGTFAANPSVFIAIELISTPGVEIGPRVPLFSSGYAQFALTGVSGTISGVTAGSGLTGGGTSGTVTLGANFAGSGIANNVARSDHNHNAQYSQLGHTHAGSDITSPVATANNALAIADNTVTSAKIVDGSIAAVDVNAAQIQLRVTSTCAVGNAVRVVNQDGTVTCQSVGSGTVTAVTASAPLTSSGGATPNISLPNVIIGGSNTAIGLNALLANSTGFANTASGVSALLSNTTSGVSALLSNTTGGSNTASGVGALFVNTTGNNNTAIGFGAGVSAGNLTNATAIGNGAIVNASNNIRLGNAGVTVIEGQVGFTASSDRNQKENFQPVDGEEVLKKIRGLALTSWNFIGHDPKQFRHYGPVAQEFFAAFGQDGIGTIGTPTTITSTDIAGILMIGVQTLEKQNRELKAENSEIKSRLEALEQMVRSRPYLTASAEPIQ